MTALRASHAQAYDPAPPEESDAPPFDAMDREQRERFVERMNLVDLRAFAVSLGDDLDMLQAQVQRAARAKGVYA